MAGQRGYAICTEARSGSTYLCRLLSSTGVLGKPIESFNPEARRLSGLAEHRGDAEAQMLSILEDGATPNGVYGVKVFANHFDHAARTRWAQRLPALSLIYLQRRDLLAQALSHVRAIQTQQWAARLPARAEPVYDGVHINNILVDLARRQARWQFYFGRNGVTPLSFYYEDVVADPQGSVDAVARLVGLEAPAQIDPQQIHLTVQRDALNDAWRAQYLEEYRDFSAFH